MPVSEKSKANLRPPPPLPDGTIRKANDKYYKIKVDGKWRYTHIVAAERYIKRPLQPNERVYFIAPNPTEETYRNPQRDDIEVRFVPPSLGAPAGERRRLIKRLRQARANVAVLEERLAAVNAYFDKAPDDIEDPGIPADWRPKPMSDSGRFR